MSFKLPACLCGCYTEYAPGGSTLSPSGSHFWYTCQRCERQTIVLYRSGMTVLVVPTCTKAPSEATMAWLNGPLRIAMRVHAEAVDAAGRKWERETIWGPACQRHGLPPGVEARDGALMLDGVQVGDADLLATVQKTSRALYAERGPTPPANVLVEMPDVVPQGPADAIVRILCDLGDEYWNECPRWVSAEVPVPPDPIRVRHDAAFGKIFESLGIVAPTEIVNRYSGCQNEPWYAFQHAGLGFVVGPRKRVISITATLPRNVALDVESILALGKRDDTTCFETNDADYRRVTIHAWTPAKVIEYMQALMALPGKAAFG